MATQIILTRKVASYKTQGVLVVMMGGHTPPKNQDQKRQGEAPPSLRDAHFSTSHWLHGNSILLKLAATIFGLY
jgi:hypothetical protein